MYNFFIKLLFLIGIFLHLLCLNFYSWSEFIITFFYNPLNDINISYDYIIVGAGSAGSILALRLSENPETSVLLIEAGPIGGAFANIPAAVYTLPLSNLNWQYETVPQKFSHMGAAFKQSKWPRGKIVGGSGQLNYMVYTRGHPKDFDQWYTNKTGYNYERDVLAYFKKSETQAGIYKNDDKYHGKNGPLRVDDATFVTKLHAIFLEAVKYLGFAVRDLNGEFSTGFMSYQANLKNGARYSTGKYLLDHKTENLKILTSTLASKILFHNKFEANSVIINKYGVERNIKAKKGIILSAGTIDSAKLLLRSGVGPHGHLKEVDVKPLVADLPVGENLQDHIVAGLDLVRINQTLELSGLSLLCLKNIYDYIIHGKGRFTTAVLDGIGFIHTRCLNINETYNECESHLNEAPDLGVVIFPVGLTSDYGANFRHTLGVSDDMWAEHFEHLEGKPVISIVLVLLHPKSRGAIRLASKTLDAKPLINPNYLHHKYDVDILVKGIELIKQIIHTPAMQSLDARLYYPPLLPKNISPSEHNDTYEYWELYFRHFGVSIYHPIGTVKMGDINDPTTVVDYDFRVKGLNKLFVADASVMPSLPSALPNAAVVMLAEKAADSIKNYDYLMIGKCTRTQWSELVNSIWEQTCDLPLMIAVSKRNRKVSQ